MSPHQENTLLVHVARSDRFVVVLDGRRDLIAIERAVREEVVLEAQCRLFGNLGRRSQGKRRRG